MIAKFFAKYRKGDAPVLLGLSGGPDSLCLFYLLLKHAIPFSVAHVDHRWRKESEREALLLQQLCHESGVKFYLKTLNPEEMKGNLEERCREERLQFFQEVYQTGYQALILGHHADDQVETVLKRLFEGAGLQAMAAMQEVADYKGMAIWRPLLKTPKEAILQWLEELQKSPFIDETNFKPQYLRARMRLELIPFLNQSFGKEVKRSVLRIADEAEEINAYLEEKCASFPIIDGVYGSYLDLTSATHPVEIKFAVRRFLKNRTVLSHDELSCCVKCILESKGNKWINRKIYIDRKKIFFFERPLEAWNEAWQVTITETEEERVSDWRDVWQGRVCMTVPAGCKLLYPNNLKSWIWVSSVLYPNNLKSWFWVSSVLPPNFCPHSCLAYRQWSLAPDKNLEEPSHPIPNFSSCLGIPPNFCPHSCLGLRQWSLAPDKNLEEPPHPIPNFSNCLGMSPNFCPHSCLGLRQWSLAPDKNLEEPPHPIPNFSNCLGMSPSTSSLDKWWTEHKVPAIFRQVMPVLYRDEKIYGEFLTGKKLEGKPPFFLIEAKHFLHSFGKN